MKQSEMPSSSASSALDRLREMRSRNDNPLAEDLLPSPGASGFDAETTSAAHEYPVEAGDWDAEVVEVLGVLVKAAAPVPHARLLAALVQRGHDREAARAAIGRSQASGWIEHDLVSGYVLSHSASSEAPTFDVK